MGTDSNNINAGSAFDEEEDVLPHYEPLAENCTHAGCAFYCFNSLFYPLEANEPGMVDKEELYKDYARIFDYGLRSKMGPGDAMYKFSSSEPNTYIPANRFPGMCIRMNFHDAATIRDPVNDHRKSKSFREYISEMIGIEGSWLGPARYMDDSSLDASVLLCREERLHMNNNYDQTASRLLRIFQTKILPDQTYQHKVSLMEKYDMSYADALANCGMAALHYLGRGRASLDTMTGGSYMTFGRRDACYIRNRIRRQLCGNSDLLPGAVASASETATWFRQRGLPAYLYLPLLAVHTLVDDFAKIATLADMMRKDYFADFLAAGKHELHPEIPPFEPENDHCRWMPDFPSSKQLREWPMTYVDCALSRDQSGRDLLAEQASLTSYLEQGYNSKNKPKILERIDHLHDIVTTLKHFAVAPREWRQALICAMLLLTGSNSWQDFRNPCSALDVSPLVGYTKTLFGSYRNWNSVQSLENLPCDEKSVNFGPNGLQDLLYFIPGIN